MALDFIKKFLFPSKIKPAVDLKEPVSAPHLEEVCVFPLPNIVLFPGTMLPLHIFEERYKLMTQELEKGKVLLAMSHALSQTDGKLVPNSVCGAGRISVTNTFPDGRKDIYVEGEKRLKIVRFIQERPYLKALAEVIPDIPFPTREEEQKFLLQLSTLVRRWIFLSPELSDAYLQYVDLFNRPHFLADFIASSFIPSGDEKQKLLETTSQKGRVENIMEFVSGRIHELEMTKGRDLAGWNPEIKILH